MLYVDGIGWIAAFLTLTSFSMKTMIPLRTMAITSNLAFITYGGLAGFYPVFALHCILLPFNIYRVVEMLRLTRRVEGAAQGAFSLDAMKPFMKPLTLDAGEVVFRKGDRADKLYFLAEGSVRLVEIGETLEKGQLFGEIGFFLSEQERTLTVECAVPCRLFTISPAALKQLCYQNPGFGFHLNYLLATRLSNDIKRLTQAPTPLGEKGA